MKIFYLLLLLIVSCNQNNNYDIFSNDDIRFKKLDLENNISYKNKYDVTNINAKLIPLNNSIKLSDKERDYIIETTGYVKDLFFVESIFLEEESQTSCLIGYMKAENNSLEKLINYIESIKNNISKNYFNINGNKNIQYKITLEDTILFFSIFEEKKSNYLILSYTFPKENEYISMEKVADSINSVEFY